MLSLIDPETGLHEFLEVEIFGNLKVLPGPAERPDTVQSKNPDRLSCMAKADQVECSVKEPDPIGVHLPFRFRLPPHAVIDYLDGFPVHGRLLGLADDLAEPAIFLVRNDAHIQGLFQFFDIVQGFGRERCSDLPGEGFERVVEHGAFENLEHAGAEMERHEFRQAKGDGRLMFH